MPRHFYATAADLLPVFERVENNLEVAYNLTGLFESSLLTPFFRGVELPTLRLPAPGPNAIAGPSYLVTLKVAPVNVREVKQNRGGVCFALDQLINPDSILFQHGGSFGSNVLLHGRVGTVSKTPTAAKLQRAYFSAISKSFRHIKAFWVGAEAEGLLVAGHRLTIGANSPPEYDLAL